MAFLTDTKLRGRIVDAQGGVWAVQTEEGAAGLPPALVSFDHLAGPARQQDLISSLAQMANEEPYRRRPDYEAGLERRRQRAEASGEPVDAFAYWQLATLVVPAADLPHVARDVLAALLATELDGGSPETRVFENAGIHVIRSGPEVLRRMKVASVWLRLAYDERLARGDIDHLSAAESREGPVFAASQNLYDGVLLLDAYVTPLMAAMAPSIWAFAVPRRFGTILYTLGRPIAGVVGDPAELLHLVHTQGSLESSPIPSLSALAPSAAIAWWVERLNAMFGVLTDLAVFTDSEGRYLPAKHLQALLTVEQLFRRVASARLSHRDSHARRVLLFTILDTLERLTGRTLENHCSLRFAKETVAELRVQMPPLAAEVLLPAADQALTALEAIQDGFFLRVGETAVEWPGADGRIDSLTPEVAAAHFIRVLRDATHGHGTVKAGRVARTNALLAQHDGTVPHDLALLGYLYLLDLLSRPDVLRKNLYRGGKE
jgi:hypothetical protein